MTQERVNQLMPTVDVPSSLRICVGSWHAYTECNQFALGSRNPVNGSFYVDFEVLDDEDELLELLDFLGWSELDKEELFVQDYESEYFKLEHCDNINPLSLIEAINDAGVDLTNENECAKIAAIMEYENCDFETALYRTDHYDLYPNTTAEEWEEQLANDCMSEEAYELINNSWIGRYITIDYEQMAKDDDAIYESEYGLLVIQ